MPPPGDPKIKKGDSVTVAIAFGSARSHAMVGPLKVIDLPSDKKPYWVFLDVRPNRLMYVFEQCTVTKQL